MAFMHIRVKWSRISGKLSEKEQCLLVLSTHFLHTSWILRNCIFATESAIREAKDFEISALRTQMLFFLKQLAGVLHEIWPKLKKFGKTRLPGEDQSTWDELDAYFASPGNLVELIRNRYAFHCDDREAKKGIATFDEMATFDIYCEEDSIQFYAGDSELALDVALLAKAGRTKEEAAANLFDAILLNVGAKMEGLAHAITGVLLSDVGAEGEMIGYTPRREIEKCPLPYFVRHPSGMAAASCPSGSIEKK
jgi:hypothetical protein